MFLAFGTPLIRLKIISLDQLVGNSKFHYLGLKTSSSALILSAGNLGRQIARRSHLKMLLFSRRINYFVVSGDFSVVISAVIKGRRLIYFQSDFTVNRLYGKLGVAIKDAVQKD